MKGADKYYDLFGGRSQQIGRLFLQIHAHARGKCFEMYLLPEGTTVAGSRIGSTKDAVQIYGRTGGQRGWTESYGWLHKGDFQDEFNMIVDRKEVELSERIEKRKLEMEGINKAKDEKTASLLASYTRPS